MKKPTYEELEKKIKQLEKKDVNRKQTEKILRIRERRFKSLLDNLPGIAFRCKNDARFTMEYIYGGCYALTGYKDSELLENSNLSFSDLIITNRESYKHDRESIRRAIEEKGIFHIAYEIRTASGEIKWVYEQGVGVYSEKGEFIAIEGFVTDFTEQKQYELALQKENIRLKSSIKDRYRFGDIIGKSLGMQKVYDLILRAASADANVVIFGETGTGKELVARAIHESSGRSENNFIPVNCGAIPETLIEAEFFGHRKGAFTGADLNRHGYFHEANGGTLFLDEIGNIGLNMQIKLLRAIENGNYTPIGSAKSRRVDLRIISATNTNLYDLVKKGSIREDFYYRLNVILIKIPPLRERKEDLPLLVEHFLQRESKKGKSKHLSGRQMEVLQNFDWPGNVRQLKNVIQRFLAMGMLNFPYNRYPDYDNSLEAPHIKGSNVESFNIKRTLEDIERDIIIRTLEKYRWNRTKVASELGIHRKALYRRMKRVGLYDPDRPISGQ